MQICLEAMIFFFIIIIQMKSVHLFVCRSLDVCLSSSIFGLLFTVHLLLQVYCCKMVLHN